MYFSNPIVAFTNGLLNFGLGKSAHTYNYVIKLQYMANVKLEVTAVFILENR